jgi:putative hydrolase of the HAD superfamily
MFEDIAKNLAVPKARGMTTTLVVGRPDQIDHRQPHDREWTLDGTIDFVTQDLAGFLAQVNDRLETLKPGEA